MQNPMRVHTTTTTRVAIAQPGAVSHGTRPNPRASRRLFTTP